MKNQSSSQSISQSVNKPASQPVSRSASQSISWGLSASDASYAGNEINWSMKSKSLESSRITLNDALPSYADNPTVILRLDKSILCASTACRVIPQAAIDVGPDPASGTPDGTPRGLQRLEFDPSAVEATSYGTGVVVKNRGTLRSSIMDETEYRYSQLDEDSGNIGMAMPAYFMKKWSLYT
eukprot:scaffold99320_cov30-Prasinocladus_malaysianus.AAC.2